MRVLHVNKFLHRRGGAEAYMLDLADLQRRAGHEVAFFGMDHPDNEPQEHAARFPPALELDPPPASLPGRLRAAGRMLWSTSAARGIDAVVEAFRPDVAHLHNVYHHLSPSILAPLARRRIPAVMEQRSCIRVMSSVVVRTGSVPTWECRPRRCQRSCGRRGTAWTCGP